MNWPNEPIGNSPLHSFCRRLLRASRAHALGPGLGYRRIIGTNGTALQIDSGGRRAGGSAQRMRVKEVHNNFLVCRTYDGTAEGTTDINVAKPPYLRHSYTSIRIDGKWYDLSYDLKPNNEDGVRFVTPQDGSGPAITEQVIPVYFIHNDPVAEIWADEPSGGVGEINDDDDVALDPQPTYMDTNRDARRWCEVQSQTQNQGLSTAGYKPTSGGTPTTDQ